MSTMSASESVFLSALQPHTSVTTYGLPSDGQIGVGGTTVSDEAARARRVQQQVQMRLAEKSTLPRQNGGAGGYASSGRPEQTPRCGEGCQIGRDLPPNLDQSGNRAHTISFTRK